MHDTDKSFDEIKSIVNDIELDKEIITKMNIKHGDEETESARKTDSKHIAQTLGSESFLRKQSLCSLSVSCKIHNGEIMNFDELQSFTSKNGVDGLLDCDVIKENSGITMLMLMKYFKCEELDKFEFIDIDKRIFEFYNIGNKKQIVIESNIDFTLHVNNLKNFTKYTESLFDLIVSNFTIGVDGDVTNLYMMIEFK